MFLLMFIMIVVLVFGSRFIDKLHGENMENQNSDWGIERRNTESGDETDINVNEKGKRVEGIAEEEQEEIEEDLSYAFDLPEADESQMTESSTAVTSEQTDNILNIFDGRVNEVNVGV